MSGVLLGFFFTDFIAQISLKLLCHLLEVKFSGFKACEVVQSNNCKIKTT